MRLRTAVLGLAIGVAVVLTGCGNGPPPGLEDTTGGGTGTGGGGGAITPVQTGTPAQKVNETDQLSFTPDSVSVKVGDIVQWTNGGSATHNVTFQDASGTNSGDMNGGATYMVKFTAAGDYAYICTYHQPNMKGTVHVTAS
jgi:plastocyanin